MSRLIKDQMTIRPDINEKKKLLHAMFDVYRDAYLAPVQEPNNHPVLGADSGSETGSEADSGSETGSEADGGSETGSEADTAVDPHEKGILAMEKWVKHNYPDLGANKRQQLLNYVTALETVLKRDDKARNAILNNDYESENINKYSDDFEDHSRPQKPSHHTSAATRNGVPARQQISHLDLDTKIIPELKGRINNLNPGETDKIEGIRKDIEQIIQTPIQEAQKTKLKGLITLLNTKCQTQICRDRNNKINDKCRDRNNKILAKISIGGDDRGGCMIRIAGALAAATAAVVFAAVA